VIEEEISIIYESIFESINLKKYVNNKEAESVYKIIKFIELTEDAMLGLSLKMESKNSTNETHHKNNDYLFTSAFPRYHKSGECKTLMSDFDNFEIPFEITQRSPSEVAKFRDFANLNRTLISNNKEDVFILRLKNEFNLKSNISKVHIINSGRIDLSKEPQDQVESKIIETINIIESFRETKEGLETLKSYINSPVKNINAKFIPRMASELLTHKKFLLELLVQYHLNKHEGNGRGSEFSENLLEFYGFRKCGVCFSDEIAFDL
jgi:hypothetical protein